MRRDALDDIAQIHERSDLQVLAGLDQRTQDSGSVRRRFASREQPILAAKHDRSGRLLRRLADGARISAASVHLAGESRAQRLANHLDAGPLVEELFCLQRFAGADRTRRAVMVAIAVEQVLVAVGAVAAAIAMELRQQFGVFLGDLVSLAHRSGELHWIQSPAQIGRGLRFGGRMNLTAARRRGRSGARLVRGGSYRGVEQQTSNQSGQGGKNLEIADHIEFQPSRGLTVTPPAPGFLVKLTPLAWSRAESAAGSCASRLAQTPRLS